MELDHHLYTTERMLVNRAKQMGVPIIGSMELLPICNMSCDMCYVRLEHKEMQALGGMRPVEEWIRIGREMAQNGVLFLLLTGGEPLLYPDFKKLYLELRKLGVILTINTNGTLIDEEWADFFGRNRPRRINITLYGKDNTAYEELCHFKNGFDKVMRGIQLLRERDVDVKIGGSVTPQNVSDIEEIIGVSKKLDVPIAMDTYMMPSKRERDREYNLEARLDPVAAANARKRVLLGEMGPELFEEYANRMIASVENTDLIEKGDCKMACFAGSCSFSVNWQGELRPCVILTKPNVSLLSEDFGSAWKVLRDGVNGIRLSETCACCRFRVLCRTCAAGALLESGRYDGVPKYICTYAEEFYKLLVQYKKELAEKEL